MVERPTILESQADDQPAIEAIYPEAFPKEALLGLVRALLAEGDGTVSLIAQEGARLVGHAILTRCAVAGCSRPVGLLGPLAVTPDRQGRSVGSALVRACLERARRSGLAKVCVLGDPGYYTRLGFGPEVEIRPPYSLPPDWLTAWQSISTGADPAPCKGTLAPPGPWNTPGLWAP
jgi:putative acetyltransferase